MCYNEKMGRVERHFRFILEDLAGVYVIPDTHFNHKMLVRENHRPAGYEEVIASNWGRKVGPYDVIFHLGDVCFADKAKAHNQYVRSMPGYKILVLGNHDNETDQWYLEHGWDDVCKSATLLLRDGRVIVLSHKPLADDGSYDVLVHGHFHNTDHRRWEPEMTALASPKHKLIALETHGYTPFPLADWV